MYVRVHRKTELMSLSLLLEQRPACLVRLTWMVFEKWCKRPYSCCFMECCFQGWEVCRICEYKHPVLTRKSSLIMTIWDFLMRYLSGRLRWSGLFCGSVCKSILVVFTIPILSGHNMWYLQSFALIWHTGLRLFTVPTVASVITHLSIEQVQRCLISVIKPGPVLSV